MSVINAFPQAINEVYTVQSVDDLTNSILNKTITSLNTTNITSIGSYAFFSCTNLSTVTTTCTSIYDNAFAYCEKLKTVTATNCTRIYDFAFYQCGISSININNCTSIGLNAFAYAGLATISLPACSYIGIQAFTYNKFTTISLPKCKSIGSSAFWNCSNLQYLWLTSTAVTTLANSNAFSGTKITATSGTIYVKSSLITQYKAANQWSYFKNRMTTTP